MRRSLPTIVFAFLPTICGAQGNPQPTTAVSGAASDQPTKSVVGHATTGAGVFTLPLNCENVGNIRCVDTANSAGWAGSTDDARLISAMGDLPTEGGMICIGSGTYTWTANVFSKIAKPVRLVFPAPAEVDLTAPQTITTSNVSIEFAGQNAALDQVGAASPESPMTPGLRFKATTSLGGPMLTVTGPVKGINLTNVHFDCNTNATMAVSADRLQASHWSGIISADHCTTIGFKFPNHATGENQDTEFNKIGILFVTRSPACAEFDANVAVTSDFDHAIIDEIACSLLGTSGATDQVYFQGADGNYVGRIWCQVKYGTGTSKSCVHFGANAYDNSIASLDAGVPSAPAVIQDGGNAYDNVILNLNLGNWISAGGNTDGNQVSLKGMYPRITWHDGDGLHFGVDEGIYFGYGSPGRTFANLGTPRNGTFYWCTDCSSTTPVSPGGTGSFVYRENHVWVASLQAGSIVPSQITVNSSTGATDAVINLSRNGSNDNHIQDVGSKGDCFTGSVQGDICVRTDNASGRIGLSVNGTSNLTVTSTGLANTLGLQSFNTTISCSTAASAGATCTTPAITMPVGYPDTNYRLACTGLSPTNIPVVQTVTKSNNSFTITIVAITAAAATYASYDCRAEHN